MNHRKGNAWKVLGSYFAPGSSLLVVASSHGATVASSSSATPITVHAGHSFQATDKFVVWSGSDLDTTTATAKFRTVSSVTSTSIAYSGDAISVVSGDILVNLGPDTGSSYPNFDASRISIYADPGAGTAITSPALSTVLANSQGEYEYYHKGAAIWEIVRSGQTIKDVDRSITSRVTRFGFGNWNLLLNPYRDSIPGYLGAGATVNSTVVIERDETNNSILGGRTSEIGFARNNQLRWAIGEDVQDGEKSFFAIWSDKGAWTSDAVPVTQSGDIFGITWAGADSGGQDGTKFRYGKGYNVAGGDYDDGHYHTFFCDTKRTSGDLRCAWFQRSTNTFSGTSLDSGGIDISATGNSRDHIRLLQDNTSYKRASIALGDISGATNKYWRIGSDLTASNTQNFGIYDYDNGWWAFYSNSTGVGIHTNSPSAVLDVAGTFEAHEGTFSLAQNAATDVAVSNADTGASARARIVMSNDKNGIAVEMLSANFSIDTTMQYDGIISTSCDGTLTGGDLHFGTRGLKRMTLTSADGKLGIGIDPPVEKVQVVGALALNGDAVSGVANYNTFTGISDVTANSTGVGAIKFKGATSRDSTGFIKIYIGTTAYYVPVFSAITG